MPANLPPDYLEAEEKYRQAKTIPERLACLREMFALIPKHKGTEKIQANIKGTIAKLKKESQRQKKKKGFSHKVEREGAGQVVLVGPPNVGKSQLINILTNASPEVASYPFTTRTFLPGMMDFEEIQIQLVDIPPVSPVYMESWVPGIIRAADALLLLVDLTSKDPPAQFEETREVLEKLKIILSQSEGEVNPVRSSSRKGSEGALGPVFAKEIKSSPRGQAGGLSNGIKTGFVYLETLLIANKNDQPGTEDAEQRLKDLLGLRFPLVSISAKEGKGLEELKRKIFEVLKIIRVFSKIPGKPADMSRPYTLKKENTLLEFAKIVHKDFGEKLKFARVWGSGKFEGQVVNKDYLLMDKDVVELHR